MFSIRFQTQNYRPDLIVTLRNSIDGWGIDIPGIYENDAWRFDLDEDQYPNGLAFKFVLEQTYWMIGVDAFLLPTAGAVYPYTEAQVQFPPMQDLVVENSRVQQLFFPPNLNEDQLFDVIVIGSGIGGGILADQLSDLGKTVLVLEAGSYLFPTHVANLPRQHQIGQFDKHVWGLYDEFRINNFTNAPGSQFNGGQAFNLGGRSLFWGGLIPRMLSWEMDFWPQPVKWFLEDSGYQRAEDLINRSPFPSTPYHQQMKQTLRTQFPDFNNFDAPMAVQYANGRLSTIPAGMFSTADLLMESRLTNGATGNQFLSVNLNHVVVRVETDGNDATAVVAYDLIAKTYRTYRAKSIVLSAGTVESAKIAQLSNLQDPSGKIGVGITDHPIYFTHFALPTTSPYYSPQDSSKILLQHKGISANDHAYNVVLEIGADYNQGRFVDDDILAEHQRLKGNMMLCELVFLFNSPLMDQNTIQQQGPSYVKPIVQIQPSPSANPFLGEIDALKDQIINALGGMAIAGQDLTLKQAGLGGVAHEVGTLRMGEPGVGVVDTNLKFHGYTNLYACDLSVFPASPAANPTLTLAALAMRLADHLHSVGG
ncbi:MAG: GMC family oxidoreductase [Synechococcales cyanobacterium T60_A2020_003]|nr:GMC family oxidoreductase [Synechococcales cyanobacterium T60_A2020_003]